AESVVAALFEDGLQQQGPGGVFAKLLRFVVRSYLQESTPAVREVVLKGDHPIVQGEAAQPEPATIFSDFGQGSKEPLPASPLENRLPPLSLPATGLQGQAGADHRRDLATAAVGDDATLSRLRTTSSPSSQRADGLRTQDRMDARHPLSQRKVGRDDYLPQDPPPPPQELRCHRRRLIDVIEMSDGEGVEPIGHPCLDLLALRHNHV